MSGHKCTGIAESTGERCRRNVKEKGTVCRLHESYGAELGLSIDVGIDPDDHLFRSLGRRSRRDISKLKHERQLNIVYLLYLGYPIAHRALEITKDYVVGEGLTFQSADPAVQQVLVDHWNDPVNRWDLKQHVRVLELGLYGEQFYTAHVNAVNGHVRLGYIDPAEVADVIPDPDNVEIARKIRVVRHINGKRQQRTLKVIQPDDNPNSPNFGRLQGDVFVFQINKVANATRGNSDLLPAIDWIELHEQYLFRIHEAAILKTSVIWDVTVKGADEKTIERMRKKFGQIKAGMTRFHNESVTVKSVAPELQTPELAEHALVIKNHIATSVGLPIHWLSEGGNSNRATAAEMGIPTTKRLRSRQRVVRDMIAYIFDFVIDQAIIAGRLAPDVNRNFEVLAPQVWANDLVSTTSAMVQGASALTIAADNGWITPHEASSSFKLIMDQAGLGTTALSVTTESPVNPEPVIPSVTSRLDNLQIEHIRAVGDEYGRWKDQQQARNGQTA